MVLTESESHLQEWLTFFENPITSQFWVANKDLPEIDCKEWYRKQRSRYQNDLGGMSALIDKRTGKLVGHAGLLVQEVNGFKELEVAYSLVPKFWHQGYATEAAKKCNYAFQNDFSITYFNNKLAQFTVRGCCPEEWNGS